MNRILILASLLMVGCAGSPPKMERPVKLFNGAPERGAVCRLSKKAIARVAKKLLKTREAKDQVSDVVKVMFAPDEIDCVSASSREFASYGCYTFSDIGVMLRWQEALLHSCDKWGKSTQIQSFPPEPAIDTDPGDPEPEQEEPFVEPEITAEDLQ